MADGIITGNAKEVYINGAVISPAFSLSIRDHSPAGFDWGYHGRGAAQLALAMLLLFLEPYQAIALYQKFKCDKVAFFPDNEDFRISCSEIETWIVENQTSLPVVPEGEGV